MNIRYKDMVINRPLIVKRGWIGNIECNSVNAYVGEWVVFKLPLVNGAEAELRMPVDEAFEEGLIVAADKIVYEPEDYEDNDIE